MTNEQLAVLLDTLQDELIAALAEVRELIAAARPRIQVERHVETKCAGFLCKNPEHFGMTEELDPVSELAPLDALVEHLGRRMDMLRDQN